MRVIGIDPGTAVTGYGVVEGLPAPAVIDCGAIRTDADCDMPDRLRSIFEAVAGLVERWRPEAVAVEELFFNKNARSALAVGQARGAVIVAAAQAGVRVTEYTPLQVKQAVTGYGRAGKDQVGRMVKVLLGLDRLPRPDDVTDALAVAICCLHSRAAEARLARAVREGRP